MHVSWYMHTYMNTLNYAGQVTHTPASGSIAELHESLGS
jgi:hypothetical protein